MQDTRKADNSRNTKVGNGKELKTPHMPKFNLESWIKKVPIRKRPIDPPEIRGIIGPSLPDEESETLIPAEKRKSSADEYSSDSDSSNAHARRLRGFLGRSEGVRVHTVPTPFP